MMGTHARRLKESLDDKIEILNTNALEASLAKEIFITVSAILALVRVRSVVIRLYGALGLIDNPTRTI